jgi:long-chain fatty acid transport protein
MQIEATLENIVTGPNNLRIDGSGVAYGANAAILFKASDAVRLGVSYRRKMRADLNGDVALTTVGLSNNGTTSIVLPDIISAGMSFRLSPQVIASLQTDYTNWSTYDQLTLTSGTFVLMGLGSNTAIVPNQWQDTVCYRLGFQYDASEQLRYRFGVLYDQNPVRSEYFDTRLPDSDREGLTIGIGHTSGRMTVDASYMYLVFKPRDIAFSYLDVTAPSLSGTYRSQAHIASASIGYRF